MRTYVYVDGFNLYYGSLKGTSHKWLDLKALFSKILRPENDIQKIKYFTARVSARPDNPDAPTRQDHYLQALSAYIPEVEIIEGHYIQKPIRARLVKKIPGHRSWYVKVLKTEEKGSDVNLAVQLVNDAWQSKFDCAVICSNDGDLADAVRIVRRERHKSVVIAVPGDPLLRPASVQLRRWASKTMHIPAAALAASHLPNPIPGTSIHKPTAW
ncbi:MAG TPA: NYN domain-containing protein [Burkholderiales bacterium]